MQSTFKCTPAWLFIVTVLIALFIGIGIDYFNGYSFDWCGFMCLYFMACIVFVFLSSICFVSSTLAWIVGSLFILSACSAVSANITYLLNP